MCWSSIGRVRRHRNKSAFVDHSMQKAKLLIFSNISQATNEHAGQGDDRCNGQLCNKGVLRCT